LLYQHKSFSISLLANPKKMSAVCDQHGHMDPDLRGKCLRCGFDILRATGRAEITDEGKAVLKEPAA
jgi:hypothetical protein